MPFTSDTKQKGVISEVLAETWFLENDYVVYVPRNPDARADLVVIKKELNTVLKVQVKSVTEVTVNGIIYQQARLRPHDRPYTEEEVDIFFFANPRTGRCWMSSFGLVGHKTSLNFGRLDETHGRNDLILQVVKEGWKEE